MYMCNVNLAEENKNKKGVLKNFAKFTRNTCTGVSFLSTTSNFIDEETQALWFPKPLTIFVESSIADVRLSYKCASALSPDLKPIYQDFLQ